MKRKRGNPTGKGGFRDNPQNINLAGAPKRGETLQETFKKLANMNRDEAAAYFGEKTDIGKQLKQLSPNIPLKDIVGIRAIITLANDSDARLLGQVGDRIEGKPNQSLNLTNSDGSLRPDSMKPSEIAARVAALLKTKDAK